MAYKMGLKIEDKQRTKTFPLNCPKLSTHGFLDRPVWIFLSVAEVTKIVNVAKQFIFQLTVFD